MRQKKPAGLALCGLSKSNYLDFFGALGRWVRADAATAFTLAGVLGLRSSLAAVVATRAEVCSLDGFLVAMMVFLPSSRGGKNPALKPDQNVAHFTC